MKSSKIYSGLATYGKVTSIMSTIIATLISIPFIALGIYFLRKHNNYTTVSQGVVENVNCTEIVTPSTNTVTKMPNIQYDCTMNVKYDIKKTSYNVQTHTTNSAKYQNGQKIDVYVDPTNPTHISLNPVNYKMMGLLFIGIPVLILIIAYVSLYFTLKYKSVAAVSGATTGISQIEKVL
jgi:hypothetical protein